MLNQLKSTLKNPDFQRKAAHAVGSVASFVMTVVISNLVAKTIENGIDIVMDKIQATETPAE